MKNKNSKPCHNGHDDSLDDRLLHRNRQKYLTVSPPHARSRSAMRPQYVRPTADRSAPTVRMMAFDFSSLELTADQKSKIDMLNQTQRKQLAQCRRDRKESKEAMKADARQKRQGCQKELPSTASARFFSPEQYTKFPRG